MAKAKQSEACPPMFIKLGRISKKVEAKMGVSVCNDVSIYLLETMANSYARDYPTSYLSLIEEIAFSIKKPDAFSFSLERNELVFLRLYPQGNELFLLKTVVGQTGKPRKWVIKSFTASKNLGEKGLSLFPAFYRLDKEKEAIKGEE